MALSEKTFDDLFTFTRASSSTYFDAAGVLQTAAVDEPRFDHDPVTGKPLGVLIEGQAANVVLRSANADHLDWYKPAGTTANSELIEKIADGYRYVSQYFTTVAGKHAFAVDAKAGTLDKLTLLLTGDNAATLHGRAIFDLTAGTATDSVSTALIATGMDALRDDWYRCWLVADLDVVTSPRALIYPDRYDQTVAGNIYARRYQVEVGGHPTSYIETVDSQITRAAENLLVTGSVFTDVFGDAEKGTVVLDFICPEFASASDVPIIFAIGPNFADTLYAIIQSNGKYSIVARVNGASLTSGEIATLTAGARHKLAVSWDSTNVRSCLDGGVVTSSALSEPLALIAPFAINRSSWSSGHQTNSTVYKVFGSGLAFSDEKMQWYTS